MDFAELQDVIERTYGDRDRERGVAATVAWLTEEIGELAQAVRKGSHEQRVHEQGVDLNEAVARYGAGCPKCASIPCAC
jgi:NTP pyrophosphatase (non-canonical NTP hydrolase)